MYCDVIFATHSIHIVLNIYKFCCCRVILLLTLLSLSRSPEENPSHNVGHSKPRGPKKGGVEEGKVCFLLYFPHNQNFQFLLIFPR